MEFKGKLYFITPIENIPSIVSLGILSNHEVRALPHDDTFAMTDVQGDRGQVLLFLNKIVF